MLWSCTACTFDNTPDRATCEMCQTPRAAMGMMSGGSSSGSGDTNPAHQNRLLDMMLEDGAPRSPLAGLFPATLPVPTLSEALNHEIVASRPHLHPSSGTTVRLAQRQARRVQSKYPALSLDMCAAITLYTIEDIPREGSLYYALNRVLRSQTRSAVRPWRDFIWLLLHALRKLPPSPVSLVYRGCRAAPAEIGLELQAGFEVSWASFSSTATTNNVMTTFVGQTGPRTMCTIQLTGAAIGRDVRDFSLFPSENEIIFPPNFSFQVVSHCACRPAALHLHPPPKLSLAPLYASRT